MPIVVSGVARRAASSIIGLWPAVRGPTEGRIPSSTSGAGRPPRGVSFALGKAGLCVASGVARRAASSIIGPWPWARGPAEGACQAPTGRGLVRRSTVPCQSFFEWRATSRSINRVSQLDRLRPSASASFLACFLSCPSIRKLIIFSLGIADLGAVVYHLCIQCSAELRRTASMLYQAAKHELQSPPSSVSLTAMAIEAGAIVATAMLLVWLI